MVTDVVRLEPCQPSRGGGGGPDAERRLVELPSGVASDLAAWMHEQRIGRLVVEPGTLTDGIVATR